MRERSDTTAPSDTSAASAVPTRSIAASTSKFDFRSNKAQLLHLLHCLQATRHHFSIERDGTTASARPRRTVDDG